MIPSSSIQTPDDGVVLYYDDGSADGLGHRRRMEALARALSRRGISAECLPLERQVSSDPRVRVVDSYHVRADDERFAGAPVVAIDDLDRNLAVDLVVHPAPLNSRHQVQQATRVLTGFEFALLNLPTSRSTPVTPQPNTLLVTLGSADTVGLGAGIASRAAKRLPHVSVTHAPGKHSLPSTASNVAILDVATSLYTALCNSQVAVVSGGVTMLESLALGLPTIVVPTARNQLEAVDAVRARNGAIITTMNAPKDEVVDEVELLFGRPEAMTALSQAARSLIDTQGAQRVADAVWKLL